MICGLYLAPKYKETTFTYRSTTYIRLQIGNWAYGQRYKSDDDVIYCQNGQVVSVCRKAKWIWRKDNGGDNSEQE